MTQKKTKTIRIITIILLSLLVAVTAAFEMLGLKLLTDPVANGMLTGSITRTIAAACLVFLIVIARYDCLGVKGVHIKTLLLIAPCLLVCLNNFPFADYLNGSLTMMRSDLIWLFAIECLAVGLFEELFFRGFILGTALNRCANTKKGVILAITISSVAFGLFHLVNLFGGAGFGAVIMQIGYSTVFGAMLAFVLLQTKCIWLAVVMHALFNFCGLLYPTLGLGNVWGIATIVLTVVVSVLVAVYSIIAFIKLPLQNATALGSKSVLPCKNAIAPDNLND